MTDAVNHWEIVPQGIFSRHFDLRYEGQIVASLRMLFWTEGCEFTIAGHAFAIRRVSNWKDGFQLFTGDQSVCEVKRNFWSRRFELTAAEERWHLQPAGWFTRNYQLLSGEGEVGSREVGIIRPTGWFTRTRVADFSNEVPPPVQLFAIFLVLVVNQRQQKQSAGGGG